MWNSVAAGTLSILLPAQDPKVPLLRQAQHQSCYFFLLVYFGVSFAGVVGSWGRG